MKLKKSLYILVLAISIFLTGYYFVDFVLDKNEQRKTNNQLKEIVRVEENISKELSVNERYDQYRKQFNNDDIIGRIIIEGANIDSLLVQTTNNSYYLNHLVDKTSNVMGSVFVDYRSDILNSHQINIYGHNSTIYDVAFKRLENYLNKDFFLNNRMIKIETLEGDKIFEIFSVKVVTDDKEHTEVIFNDEDEFSKHIERLRLNSLYDSSIEVTGKDQILVLQTCLMDKTLGEYLIIVGRKV